MPFSPFTRKLLQGLASGLTGILLAAGLWASGLTNRWEAMTWDWRAALLARPSPASNRITLIFLDQNSLDWGQKENGLSWPWPREVYAAIIDFCRRNGAKSVALDVIFSEPSAYGVADDMALAQAMADYGRTAGVAALGRESGHQTVWPVEAPEPVFPVHLSEKLCTYPTIFPRAAFPISELTRVMAVVCNARMNPDPDGIYRTAAIVGMFDGRPMPSLGLGAYLAAHPDTPMDVESGYLSIGKRRIPLTNEGTAILRFIGPAGSYRSFSAAAVIQSELRIRDGQKPIIDDPEAFRDKFVFFGFTAPGLFDLRPTPVDGITPGVEIHATILDNLLAGQFLRSCPAGVWGTGCLLLALCAGVLTAVFSSPAGNILVSMITLMLPSLAAAGGYLAGWSLPLVVPEIAAAGAISVAFIINYSIEGRQKRFIQGAFKQYLSPAVIDQLILHPERLRLGGERRVLSIFFSDLEGFTSLSEKLDPEALTALLNEYLSAMTDIIHEEAGTVDKFEGDAIIAFWNAPLEVGDHPVRVVRAALQCQEKLAAMNPQFEKRIGKELRMRIGIHTGSAIVGNMGSHSRFDYTMMGDSVNLASRLEGANKAFGTYVMISEATRQAIGEAFPVREMARLAVVGRKEPVTVYEPMLPAHHEASRAVLESFDEGLRMFYDGRFQEAAGRFSTIASVDAPAARYLDKCRTYMASPPEDWKGIWTMTSK